MSPGRLIGLFVDTSRGSKIVTQGEIGDRFYIIEEGEVSITVAKGNSEVRCHRFVYFPGLRALHNHTCRH